MFCQCFICILLSEFNMSRKILHLIFCANFDLSVAHGVDPADVHVALCCDRADHNAKLREYGGRGVALLHKDHVCMYSFVTDWVDTAAKLIHARRHRRILYLEADTRLRAGVNTKQVYEEMHNKEVTWLGFEPCKGTDPTNPAPSWPNYLHGTSLIGFQGAGITRTLRAFRERLRLMHFDYFMKAWVCQSVAYTRFTRIRYVSLTCYTTHVSATQEKTRKSSVEEGKYSVKKRKTSTT